MTKHATGTYEIDVPGPLAELTAEQKASLTRQLRAAHKDDTLGDTEVVSREGDIGGVQRVTVRAEIAEAEKAPAKSTEK